MEQDDALLVGRAQAGARDAFTALVRAHHAAVRSYVARFVRGRDAADDVAQEVFIAAHRGLAGFRGDASFRLWLLAIARRRVIDFLRAQSQRSAPTDANLDSAFARWLEPVLASDEHELVQREKEAEALEECLKRLSSASVALVSAYYFEEQRAVAIAANTGTNVNTIRSTLMRIRDALRSCIESRLVTEIGHG